MVTTLIFDFDGTIADTLPFAEKIIQDLSETYGYQKLSKKELDHMREYSIREIFSHMHVPLYKLPFLTRDIRRSLHQQRDSFKPIKGIPSVLKTLKQKGVYLGIVTSNNKPLVKAFLEKYNLDFFDAVYTGSSLFGKARVINDFFEKNKISKQTAIYVGDEIRDIEAVKKVGIPIISVTWGLNSKKGLKRFKPDYLVEKPQDILDILSQI